MLSARCRKFCQTGCALPTVNTIRVSSAKPEGSAAFTYFQIQSQVLHVSPFQSVSLPWRAFVFSAVERARAGCYECRRLEDPQGFITGLSTLSFLLSRAASDLWDKFNAISPPGIRKDKMTVTPEEPGVAIHLSKSWRESLKVIALDKVNVNANLCHRTRLSKRAKFQGVTEKSCCRKINFRLIFVLRNDIGLRRKLDRYEFSRPP